jgi:hypothetical protein
MDAYNSQEVGSPSMDASELGDTWLQVYGASCGQMSSCCRAQLLMGRPNWEASVPDDRMGRSPGRWAEDHGSRAQLLVGSPFWDA